LSGTGGLPVTASCCPTPERSSEQGRITSTSLKEVLGKVKTGKGCLYIKSLADVDQHKLRELIDEAWRVKRPHE
jgi:hypothetical protein